jgi:hypothetical protein
MRGLFGFIASAALGCVPVGAATADTIATFDVVGSFSTSNFSLYPSGTSLSGILQVDVTTGTVLFPGTDLNVAGLGAFIGDGGGGPDSTGWNIEVLGAHVGETLNIDFTTSPTVGSLVGFTGGTILSGIASSCCRQGTFFSGLTGSITLTPLPATLPLFASALGALGLLGWRKKRKKRHN